MTCLALMVARLFPDMYTIFLCVFLPSGLAQDVKFERITVSKKRMYILCFVFIAGLLML